MAPHRPTSPYYLKLHEGCQNRPPARQHAPGRPDALLSAAPKIWSELPERCLHLMVRPPYNVTKEYDQDLSLIEYLDLLR
jgi:hypothetical protein